MLMSPVLGLSLTDRLRAPATLSRRKAVARASSTLSSTRSLRNPRSADN